MNLNKNTLNRNYGIDLLRLVASFYVICLHTIYRGGIYDAATPYSHQFFTCQFLAVSTFCSVNIFGIISGYVGYCESKKELNYVSYVMLWLEVVFYSVLITLCFLWLCPETVSVRDLWSMFFPVTNNHYWYFTSYTLLFFFTPLLNNAVQHSSRESLFTFFTVIIIFFSTFETITGYFSASGGYSFLWLMLLYLLGSIIKKLSIGKNISPFILCLGIIGSNICAALLYRFLPELAKYGISVNMVIFQRYTFPLYLISSVLHVILFSKIQLNSILQKIMLFAAPGAFAAYLINVQKYIWDYSFPSRFKDWATSSAPGLILRIVSFSALFLTFSVIVDYLRRKLFQLLHIKELLLKLKNVISCPFIS